MKITPISFLNFFSIFSLILILGSLDFDIIPTAHASVDNGLVAHWKLDEATSTNISDSINNNNGTGAGNPDHVIGKLGRAFSFDGSQGVNINGDGNDYMFTFSISFWIKTADTAAEAIISDSKSGFAVSICNGGNIGVRPYQNSITSPTIFCGLTPINDNQWHMITITRDPTDARFRMYVDGVISSEDWSSSDTGFPVNGYNSLTVRELAFNYNRKGNFGGFTGRLDDVRVYNRTLNNPEDPESLSEDVIGNLYALGSVTNTTAPYLAFTSTPNDIIATNTVSINFEYQAQTTLVCTLDGNVFVPCISPATLDNLTNNSHEFSVKATDEIGNESIIINTFSVNVPPTPIPIPNTPPTITLNGSATINLTVGDIFVYLGVMVSDYEDATSMLLVSSSTDPIGGVNTNIAGTYVITYTVEDTAHAQASTTRVVIVNAIPTTAPITPPENTGSSIADQSSGSSSSSSRNRSFALFQTPSIAGGGQVLGASASCGIYLNKELMIGKKNDTENTIKLQAIINEITGSNIPLTGTFGYRTLAAVKKFQLMHKESIITPWIKNGVNPQGRASGIVGTTTLWTINNMVCPSLQLPKPVI